MEIPYFCLAEMDLSENLIRLNVRSNGLAFFYAKNFLYSQINNKIATMAGPIQPGKFSLYKNLALRGM